MGYFCFSYAFRSLDKKGWLLRGLDSNQDLLLQRQMCNHYTTPQFLLLFEGGDLSYFFSFLGFLIRQIIA